MEKQEKKISCVLFVNQDEYRKKELHSQIQLVPCKYTDSRPGSETVENSPVKVLITGSLFSYLNNVHSHLSHIVILGSSQQPTKII